MSLTEKLLITCGMSGVFFGLIVAILYMTYRQQTTFTDYAVGGRSFSAWYIAMSYANSWWPGATYIAYFGLAAGSGVVGFYALSYSLVGVATMYFMARRAWNWGQRFNLRTQPDMIGLRYGSKAAGTIASVIGVISLFPWIVLAMQAMGTLVSFMTYGELGTTAALLVGMAVIVIRQYWTVRMGMRGLVITDLIQGIVAYLVAALVLLLILVFYFDGFAAMHKLNASMFNFPGDGPGVYGIWYFPAIIFTGIVGSLCWPTSYQRIYTADSVRSVKLGTLLNIPISGIFYTMLTLVAMSAATLPQVVKAPQDGFFLTMEAAGGTWLLALGCLIVLAASMGWIDGCVQVCGTQVANDIVGKHRDLTDRQLTVLAKASMVVFLVLGVVVAYATFNYDKLINLAIMAYQGIIQLAVPMFAGLFWRRGTRNGAIAGMLSGFVVALILTAIYPDHVSWLGGATAGIPALALNLVVFVVVSLLQPQSDEEKARVDTLFAQGDFSLRRVERPAAGVAGPEVLRPLPGDAGA
jgi:SSS family solute:Na+ symporter